MKHLIKTILLILSINSLNGQAISLSCDKLNYLYIGVDNPLTVVVENTDCSNIKLSSSIGNITGDSCHYNYRCDDPTLAGQKTIVSIHQLKNKKLIEIKKLQLRLKNLPNPSAMVGTYSAGRISSIVLKNQEMIRLYFDGFDFDLNLNVESFVLSIIRGDSCFIKQIENSGKLFNTNVKNALQNIKKGDTVIFKQITCKERKYPNKDIYPLVFYIDD